MNMALVMVLVGWLWAGGGQAAPPCPAEAGRESARVQGTTQAGATFEAEAGSFVFRLVPTDTGWMIRVHEPGREADLSQLTPPWHFVPNPRQVEGWHFRNADNTGPNDGSVNAPQHEREFIFSPELGRATEYGGSGTRLEDVERVRAFGRGELRILDFDLSPVDKGQRARFLWLQFEACLSWPAGYRPDA